MISLNYYSHYIVGLIKLSVIEFHVCNKRQKHAMSLHLLANITKDICEFYICDKVIRTLGNEFCNVCDQWKYNKYFSYTLCEINIKSKNRMFFSLFHLTTWQQRKRFVIQRLVGISDVGKFVHLIAVFKI